MAMLTNLPNSLSPFLAYPSTMFVGTERAALLNWEVNPYISSFGKVFGYLVDFKSQFV
jgi:hypothetical protein